MDRKLLLLINQQWTSPGLDRCMAALSSFDLWAPLLLLGALLLLWRGSFLVRALVLVAAIAAGISDGLVCRPLKQTVGRLRPHQALPGIRCVDLAKARPRVLALAKPAKVTLSQPAPIGDGRSFPSSHTANTMAAAMACTLLLKRGGWMAFAVPMLVGYSRVYTGSHWPSDVAGSLVLGALIGALGVWAAATLWRRLAPRWLPRLAAQHPQLLPA